MTSIESNPRIYYRTSSTPASDPSYPDPSLDFTTWIANFPATQILEFENNQFIIEELRRVRQQNITYGVVSNPGGTHSISSQYNGMMGKQLQVIMSGDAIPSLPKQKKIEQFMYRLQKEQSFHQNGSGGIWFPPAPIYNLDPDATKGYYFDNDETVWSSRTSKDLSMVFMLKFGGIKVART